MKNHMTGFALLGALVAVGCGDKDADTSVVEVNNAPTADAGEDITQSADLKVDLDGAKSFDEDGVREPAAPPRPSQILRVTHQV